MEDIEGIDNEELCMDTQPISPDEIEALYEELGLDLLPPEEREEVVARIGEVIFEGVMFRTVQALDDVKKEALTQLFDASHADPENEQKQEAIQAFIATNVPDFASYLTQEIDALKNAPQDLYANGT
jgi:hypothetical protein